MWFRMASNEHTNISNLFADYVSAPGKRITSTDLVALTSNEQMSVDNKYSTDTLKINKLLTQIPGVGVHNMNECFNCINLTPNEHL